jgi:hypothetical protein
LRTVTPGRRQIIVAALVAATKVCRAAGDRLSVMRGEEWKPVPVAVG